MFPKHLPKTLVIAILLSIVTAMPVFAQKSETAKPVGVPVIWRDPGDISRRNLTFGPGASELAPVAPFTFIKEELTGESAKFDVRDARGETWVVKVGPEAQAETVATRLIWAVGYFADEAYYLDRAEIQNPSEAVARTGIHREPLCRSCGALRTKT